jgi:hypothetical protein
MLCEETFFTMHFRVFSPIPGISTVSFTEQYLGERYCNPVHLVTMASGVIPRKE